MRGRSFLAFGLALTAGLAAVATGRADVWRTETSQASVRTIASTTTTDFRVVVSATNLGVGGGAPPAAVTVRTFERESGVWRQTSKRRLAGVYFWKTLTGRLAVCRLEIRTTQARPGFRPRVVVQLLRSPSLGCGPVSVHRMDT